MRFLTLPAFAETKPQLRAGRFGMTGLFVEVRSVFVIPNGAKRNEESLFH